MSNISLVDDPGYIYLWKRLENAVESKRSAQPAECENCQGCDCGPVKTADASKACSLSSRTGEG